MWSDFQKALYELLTSDSTLMGMVKEVSDYMDASKELPVVNIGDDILEDWDDKFKDGGKITSYIHIWSDAPGYGEAKGIADRIRYLLRNNRPQLDSSCGYAVIATGRQGAPAVSIREEDGAIRHVVLQYEYLVEEV